MKSGNVLLSIIHLFILLVIFGAGFLFVSFPYAPKFSLFLANLIVYSPKIFLFIGIVLITIGILFFLGLSSLHKYRFLELSMKKCSCEVDPKILEKYIQSYWRHAYPGQSIESIVKVLPDQRIEIVTEIKDFSLIEQEIFLEKAESEIGTLLEEKLHYHKSFLFTVLV